VYALISLLLTEATPFACINCNKTYVTSNELIIFSMTGKYVEYVVFSEEYKIAYATSIRISPLRALRFFGIRSFDFFQCWNVRVNLIYGFGGVRDRLDLILPPTRISKIILNYLRQFGGIRLIIQTNLRDKGGCIKDLVMKNAR
jgi:hypothetical protein